MLMIKIKNIRWINQYDDGILLTAHRKRCKTPLRSAISAFSQRNGFLWLNPGKESAMTTFDHAAKTMQPAVRPVTAVRVVNWLSNLYRAFKNRREFYRMGELTDHELADIGLTRADLHVVVDLPFGVDPTARLGSIARSRATVEDLARRVH